MSVCKVRRAQGSQSLNPDTVGRSGAAQNSESRENRVHETRTPRGSSTANDLWTSYSAHGIVRALQALTNASETLDTAKEHQQRQAEEERRDRVLRSAFECREELVTYARALLGNYAAAEDAVQEAMLVVVAKHDQFEEGTSVLAWCRSIVRIEVLRAKRRHHREFTLAQRVLDDAIDGALDEFQSSRPSHERELRRDALAQCIQQI